MKIDYQDKIDEYLLHRMSDEERMAFENEANSDKELQEQLSFTGDVQQVLKSRNEKLAKMEEWQDDYEWEEEPSMAAEYSATGSGYDYCPAPSMDETRSMPRSSGRKVLLWISGIAAMFVVGFFLIQNLYVTKMPNDYMTSPKVSNVTFRAGSDNSDIELLLSQKRYDEAFEMIEEKCLALKDDSLKLEQDVTIDGERKEYDLQIVKDKQDELKWLKAHALLGLKRTEEAVSIFDGMRQRDSKFKSQADSVYNMYK